MKRMEWKDENLGQRQCRLHERIILLDKVFLRKEQVRETHRNSIVQSIVKHFVKVFECF